MAISDQKNSSRLSFPLTVMQQRMIALNAVQPTADILSRAMRLVGPFQMDKMRKSVEWIAQENPLFLGKLVKDAHHSELQNNCKDITVIEYNCQNMTKSAFYAYMESECMKPFELKTDPLIRILFFKISAQESLMIVSSHHLLADGPTMAIAMMQLAKIFVVFEAGGEVPAPQPRTEFIEYAKTERADLQSRWGERASQYWQSILNQQKTCTHFSTTPHSIPLRCADLSTHFSGERFQKIKELANASEVNVFAICTAAFQCLLNEVQPDSFLSITLSLRLKNAWRSVYGPMFIQALLTNGTHDESFSDQAKRLMIEIIRGQRNAIAGDTIGPHGSQGMNLPPHQVALIVFHTSPNTRADTTAIALGGTGGGIQLGENLMAYSFDLPWRMTPYGLFLSVADMGDQLLVKLIYNTTLYTADQAKQFLQRWESYLC